MANESRKVSVERFPLRLMPSVRRTAEAFSEREGVSLNQFINVAVAEKLAHLKHDEWLRGRKKPTSQSIAKALFSLDHGGNHAVDQNDRLPTGYKSIQGEYASLSASKTKV